jgi:predicted secreted Zn-dependent protease
MAVQTADAEPAWLTREELARQLRVSLPTISRYGARLPGFETLRIGRQLRYRRVAESAQNGRDDV